MTNPLALFNAENLETIDKASTILSRSPLIPSHLIGKKADVYTILMMGQELGIPPLQSLNGIDVIKGKPTIKPQLMIALVRKAMPDAVIIIKKDDANIRVQVTCARHKLDSIDQRVTSTWDMQRAKNMGLAHKDNYKKQPLVMLQWRAVAECFRAVFPDVLMGMYFKEELEDFDGKEVVDLSERDEINEDFPIPLEEGEHGPLYRAQNGKFRGLQLKDCCVEDIRSYINTLEKRADKDGLKKWESELLVALLDYSENYEDYQDILAQVEEEEAETVEPVKVEASAETTQSRPTFVLNSAK